MTVSDNRTNTDWNEEMNAVGAAAVSVIGQACGVELTPTDEENMWREGAVIGVISIMGDVDWSVFLGLPRDTAEILTEKFAGFEIPFDSEDMGDAVGELTNILAGNVKSRLAEKGVRTNISLPNVLRAENLQVLVQRSACLIKSCFTSEAGKLWTGVVFLRDGGFVA
jgi:CheY-specific phosphatase CheX